MQHSKNKKKQKNNIKNIETISPRVRDIILYGLFLKVFKKNKKDSE